MGKGRFEPDKGYGYFLGQFSIAFQIWCQSFSCLVGQTDYLLAKLIICSGDAVWKVFEAATKKKAWDIFTKAQRKTISQWHAVIRNVSRTYTY